MSTEQYHIKEIFFQNALESFVILDKDFKILEVNDYFLKNFGAKRSDIIGRKMVEISPGVEKTKRYQVYKEVLETGVPQVLDNVKVQPILGDYITRINVFKVGEGIGICALNITDVYESVSELEQVTYKASHDLRAPLSTMLGLINLAEIEKIKQEEFHGYLTMLKQQVKGMDNLLQKIFTATSFPQNKLLHKLSFRDVYNEAIKQYLPATGANVFSYKPDHGLELITDKSLLIAILQNIYENCIKFSHPERELKIITEAKKVNEEVLIVIEDNGMGISKEYVKKVFDIFFRGTTRGAGAGIGLYTVKRCVRALQGKVRLHSSEGEATSIEITLPLSYRERISIET